MHPVHAFVKHVLPPCVLGGMTFSTWWRTLRDNNFAVDVRYLPRALGTTLFAAVNSAAKAVEDLRFRKRVEAITVTRPVFVLGHWRSGTTHLHNLLALDDRLCAPTTYQAFNPWAFLQNEWLITRAFGWMVPVTRPMDDVRSGFNEPQEDEFALCIMGAPSPYVPFAFPQSWDRYERFLTFDGASEDELDTWKTALEFFTKKVVYRYDNRTPVLKSPTHTCRIRMILDVFPDARFVHVRRNPLDVYRSTRHTWERLMPWMQVQRPRQPISDDDIITRYNAMHEALYRDQALLGDGQWCEIAYESLCVDAIRVLREVYETIGLDDFSHVEPTLRDYCSANRAYPANRFDPLPTEVDARLRGEWQPWFARWGYA